METKNFVYLVEVTTSFLGNKQFRVFPCNNLETAKKKAERHFKIYIKIGHFTEVERKRKNYFASDKNISDYVSVEIKRKKII
ncbi:MAG: hypothetical protein IAC58_04195 [Firmicutes bacterium]|uniref:Uncharacterized protein n=1 Tax=Candidatus Onthovivens merdipullorum TaxID=2840889 RepID=A0A9D9DIZ4_9BACL|nr:hypothetical protein [Candidatus Onthovivens merdipullorum]